MDSEPKSVTIDRSRITFGLLFMANALIMIAAPHVWYDSVPGVSAHGAYNEHFVRDLGITFLVVATSFVAAGMRPAKWNAALTAATAIVVLHALVHIGEAVFSADHHLLQLADVPTVYLPAILALILTFPSRRIFSR